MSRKCSVAKKRPMSGHNVSHANNKTKRVYNPNIQVASFYSEALGKRLRFRMSAAAIRTIDFKGGIDSWIMQAKNLDKKMTKLKALIASKIAA